VLLPLKLDYKTLPKDADAVQTTIALLRHAVNSAHQQGLAKLDTMLWANIDEKLDDQPVAVDLTVEQWKFLRAATDTAKMPVAWSQLTKVLFAAMEDVERSI
jgi:hypothetical protein